MKNKIELEISLSPKFMHNLQHSLPCRCLYLQKQVKKKITVTNGASNQRGTTLIRTVG